MDYQIEELQEEAVKVYENFRSGAPAYSSVADFGNHPEVREELTDALAGVQTMFKEVEETTELIIAIKDSDPEAAETLLADLKVEIAIQQGALQACEISLFPRARKALGEESEDHEESNSG